MISIIAYLKIIRPINAILTAIGVALGFWLSNVSETFIQLLSLIAAAICALSFGNVINDIKDADSDRTNHPERPIPKGEISHIQALIFAILLAIFSLYASKTVSIYHCIGTLIPLAILTIYTLFLKGTPLLGNIVVSMLVAYPLVFGGIGSPHINILIVPAILAFLLNLSREIVKDMQDKEGDLKAGVNTTASLSDKTLMILLIIPGLIYIPFMFIPFLLNHFHLAYLSICVVILLPLHLYWFSNLMGKNRIKKLGGISTAIKLEMLVGLAALTFDKLLFNIF